MIIAKDKHHMASDTPSTEWAEENGYYLVTDPDLEYKISYSFPEFEFIFDEDGNLVDVETDVHPPEPPKSLEEKIEKLETQNQMLTDCLLEMSEIVYGGDM